MIIGVNVAIWLLDLFSPPVAEGAPIQWVNYFLALKSDQPWAVWNYLTHGFAHSSFASETGFWHLAGNMISLFFLGRAVEEYLGKKEFLRFYLISILVAGIGFSVIKYSLGQPFLMLGASGAVSAVIALFIFKFPHVTLNIWGVLPVPAWLLGVILLLSDFSLAFRESHIAWQAHLIGFAFGAAYHRFGWNFTSFQFGLKLSNPLKSGPKLKLHNPLAADEDLQEQADRILQKISDHGESSLTAKERKILNRHSEQLRQRRRP